MTRRVLSYAALAWACGYAQPPAFEVASVKPASPDARAIECSGGPGTESPGIWRCSNVPIGFIITRAYDFQAYQFPPNHDCCRERFDFTARLPAGTTREQFRQMMRSLLEDRFRLKFHLQSKEMPVEELSVGEKGPKLRPAREDSAEEDPWAIPEYSIGKDGYPVFPPGRSGVAGNSGNYRWKGYGVGMGEIARTLSFYLGRPVMDSTGLKAKYDIDLTWSIDLAGLMERAGRPDVVAELPENAANGPTLRRAVQDQLGLKLTTKKGRGEIVVIDHLEKVPLGN